MDDQHTHNESTPCWDGRPVDDQHTHNESTPCWAGWQQPGTGALPTRGCGAICEGVVPLSGGEGGVTLYVDVKLATWRNLDESL